MPGTTVPLAPIPLARARLRLLFGPLVLLAAGLLAAAAGAQLGGAAGIGLVAAGVVVDALALYLAVVLFSVRLDVEVAMLRLGWLGGERRYVLSRGAVTRVALRGQGAASLRPRFGAIGWAMGPATLRGTERIELVRLARSASVILVPTDRGRLAIAPASEQQLLTALGAAARVQQRLDEVVVRARALPAAPEPAVDRRAVPPPPEPPLPTGAHLLTGIERTLLEERLAAERAAALAAAEAERAVAEAERAAAAVAARGPSGTPPVESTADVAIPAVRAGPHRRLRTTWRRPAWLGLAAPAWPRLAAIAIAVLPLAAALGVWGAAAAGGRLDLPDARLRPISLALAAAGPLAALGALAAQAWFPRLLGLVVLSSLAALVLVGRALLG